MPIRMMVHKGTRIAIIESDGACITDAQSALDLIAAVRYESGSGHMIVDKSALADEFFVLSSGLAGEVLQKFVNYRMKLAIVGDYSAHTSKPLRDFIYESNSGRDIFFVHTEEEAAERLSRV